MPREERVIILFMVILMAMLRNHNYYKFSVDKRGTEA